MVRLTFRLILVAIASIALGPAPAGAGTGSVRLDFPATPLCPAPPASGPTIGMSTERCPSAFGANAEGAAGLGGTGSISGTVTEAGTGDALVDICAQVFAVPGGFVAAPRTDTGGAYTLDGLLAGTYHIWFTDCGAGGFHLPEWYDGQFDPEDATDIAVLEGQDTGGIDAALAPGGGGISGTVTEAGTGLPLTTACVLAYDASGVLASVATTGGGGQYTVGGLSPGPYTVFFIDCLSPNVHVGEFYNNSLLFEHTNPVSVVNGSKSAGIDAALAIGAAINGRVTEQGSGTPLEGICISAFDSLGLFRGSDTTDASGDYVIGGLPAFGTYKLRFVDCGTPLYHVIEWYNNRTTFDTANNVATGASGTKAAGINVTLAIGGSISGTASDAQTKAPLRDICVDVWTLDGEFVTSGQTDASGGYEVGGLVEAEYRLFFFDCSAAPMYVQQWWQGRQTFDSADAVATPIGVTRQGISPLMARGGFINGTVTDRNGGEALAWICVRALDSQSNSRDFTRTDLLGRYRLALPTGSYKIVFYDCRTLSVYQPVWYNNHQGFNEADPVAVGAPGSKTSGRNGSLALLILGDVSCDEDVTSVDALLILQAVADLLAELPCNYASDVDDDGFYGATDALLILQYVIGLISTLPP